MSRRTSNIFNTTTHPGYTLVPVGWLEKRCEEAKKGGGSKAGASNIWTEASQSTHVSVILTQELAETVPGNSSNAPGKSHTGVPKGRGRSGINKKIMLNGTISPKQQRRKRKQRRQKQRQRKGPARAGAQGGKRKTKSA